VLLAGLNCTLESNLVAKEKSQAFFACLSWRERTRNYCKGASSSVPANRSISILQSGLSFLRGVGKGVDHTETVWLWLN
jgi:hypothetical protein